MKTTQLIDILTDKDKEEILSVIKKSKRSASLKLFKYLNKYLHKESYLSVERLYKHCFEQDYNPKKDYLLRNELRLINQHIEQQLALKQLDKKQEKYFYLKTIQSKGLHKLFEQEVKKEIKKGEKDQDYAYLYRLHQLLLQQDLKHKIFNRDNLKDNFLLSQKIDFIQQKKSAYEQAELEVSQAFLLENLKILGENTSELSQKETFNIQDSYTLYLKHKAKAYGLKGKEKQEQLQQELEKLKEVVYYKLDKEKAYAATLNNLAVEYLLAFEYEAALSAFRQLLSFKNLSDQVHDYVRFNYLSCLLKAGHTQTAVELIASDFSDGNFAAMLKGRLHCIKAMAWIMANQLKLAHAATAVDLKEGTKNDYLYLRIIISILHYLDDNQELAIREIDNTLQVVKNQKNFPDLKNTASFLKRFYSNLYKRTKLRSLQQAIKQYIHPSNKGSDLLPLLWLQKELDGLVENKGV